MAYTNGTIGEIIKVLDIANVEVIAISLPDSRIVDVTKRLAQSWKCSKYETIGQQLSQSPQAPFYARYTKAGLGDVGGKSSPKVKVTYTGQDNTEITREFSPQHHRDANSEFLLLIGDAQHQNTETTPDTDHEWLQFAVEAGGYSSWQSELDSNSSDFSAGFNEMLGRPPNDQLSRAKFLSLVHPADNAATLHALVANQSGGQKFLRSEYRIKHQKGHYIWAEMVARVIYDPITKEPTRLVGLARDISTEKNRQLKTETNRQNLARSQAAAKIGSWVLDIETGETDWSDNTYALIGAVKSSQTPPDFSTFTSLLGPDDLEKWQECLDQAKTGHAISDLALEFSHPDGDTHRFSVQIDIEFDPDGKPAKLHGLFKDITDQILLERKFLQAQKMESVGQLTGGIAHDFNNLLMVVLGNLQLIEKLTRGNDAASERLATAIDAINKGSELTKRLLAFSRQQTLEDEEIAINSLIIDMEDMLKRAINSTINLKITPGEDIWPVRADKTQLETAILNLAINARDAMKDGGSLIVETKNQVLDAAYCKRHEDVTPGEYAMIAVSDTGHGMPDDIIDKVLQPFFTTKGPGAGSGLGLSMIYGFVKQSKGHLNIYSEEGMGTTIRLYLPRDTSAAISEPEAAQQQDGGQQETIAPPAPAANTPIVLIAEDNDPVRDVAVAMIEDMGYIVLDAANGEDALEIIKQRADIDLLLSDVVMPGMNGPELAAAALEIRPELKVLFASGYTQGTAEEMHELPNFIELIDKPFTQEDLTGKVRAAVEKHRDRDAA